MTSLVYNAGTASVTNGSAVVAGHGTAWKIALVEGGSFSLAGRSVPILSVDSDTSLTLAYDWPGAHADQARYAIARETSQAVRAAWINDRLAQFHQKPWGIGVLPDGRGTLAERAALNPMPTDSYCWLRVEVDQPAELYFKVPTGWLGPFRLSGDVGPVGPAGVLRWITTGWQDATEYQINDGLSHNGTSYRAYVAHVSAPETEPGAGANWQDAWQVTAQGTILIEGTTTTLPPDQPARVEFVPVPGGYAVNFFVPRGLTGDMEGLTPYWQERVTTDADADAALAGLGAQKHLGWKPISGNIITPAGANAVVIPVPAGCGSVRISGSIKSDSAHTYMRLSYDGGVTFMSAPGDYVTGTVSSYHDTNASGPTSGSAQVIAALINGDAIVPTQFSVEIDSTVPLGFNLPRIRTLSYGITSIGAPGSMYRYEQFGFARAAAPITHILLFTSDNTNFGDGTRFLAEAF